MEKQETRWSKSKKIIVSKVSVGTYLFDVEIQDVLHVSW